MEQISTGHVIVTVLNPAHGDRAEGIAGLAMRAERPTRRTYWTSPLQLIVCTLLAAAQACHALKRISMVNTTGELCLSYACSRTNVFNMQM